MEAFSLLKYWRNSGTGSGGGPDGGSSVSTLTNGAGTGGNCNVRTSSNSTTTIVTAVSSLASETDDEEGNGDDGPFFDLEFAVPDEEVEEALQHSKTGETDDDDDDDSDESDAEEDESDELKFTLSSASSGDCTDPNVSVSPSGDLFFKGRLVPFEHSSTDLNGLENNAKLHFPVSLAKSATKLRVMMLKLKKSKSNVSKIVESKTLKKEKIEKSEPEKEGKEHSKLFTVKLKANELPILSSLFVRDNSSKNLTSSKPQKQNIEESVALDEKKFSKETVQRYLKKVKPLYIRVSKRYGEKLSFSGQLNLSGAAKDAIAAPPSTAEKKSVPPSRNEKESTPESKDATAAAVESNVKNVQKQGSLPAGLRVVYKHLGKSRSASSTAAVAAAPARAVSSKRRDDSLLQQQDGIQGAILHCKRSFKASRDLERSVSADSSSRDKETCR